jgi:hypothetical protein
MDWEMMMEEELRMDANQQQAIAGGKQGSQTARRDSRRGSRSGLARKRKKKKRSSLKVVEDAGSGISGREVQPAAEQPTTMQWGVLKGGDRRDPYSMGGLKGESNNPAGEASSDYEDDFDPLDVQVAAAGDRAGVHRERAPMVPNGPPRSGRGSRTSRSGRRSPRFRRLRESPR